MKKSYPSHIPMSYQVILIIYFIACTSAFSASAANLSSRHDISSNALSNAPVTNMKATASFSRKTDLRNPRSKTIMSISLSPNMIKVAESIAPRVGILTSTALYFSPMKSVLAAIRSNSIGNLNPIPLDLMAIVSVAWLAYGLCVRDKFVALSNILGCIASIGYVVGILPLLQANASSLSSSLRLSQGIVLGGVAVTLFLWTYLALSGIEVAMMGKRLGLFASFLFILFCISPLSTIGNVLAQKDASSILAPLTMTQVFNCGLWSAYGLAVKDIFVWGPNVIGLGLGLIQLALKLLFP